MHRAFTITALLVVCLFSALFTQTQSAAPAAGGAAQNRSAALTPPSVTPRAVCTFESIGLYWTPAGGAEEKECQVRYRPAGEATWREALPLWFDRRNGEYRGSIVQLRSGTTYEVRLALAQGPSVELKATTWSEAFPIARTVEVDDLTGKSLAVDQSGTADGYVLYTHRKGATTATLDGANQVDNGAEVTASYVILRGLTIRAPRAHGIVLGKGAHDVVIEGCDISGWGRIHADGWGVDMDSAIYSNYRPLVRVVVQGCRMHDPRSNANSWHEYREAYNERYHPDGPQGITFIESEGNHVFRYNDFATDDNHYCNDIFGGAGNKSLRGFPGADSDVYGNRLEGCWDDGLEMEGGGCNVRVWGNYIGRTMVKIAIAGLSIGPIYIFRNVVGSGKQGIRGQGGGAFVKMGSTWPDGGGRSYIIHNTILQPVGDGGKAIGCDEGWAAHPLSVVSRNNILHVRGSTSIRGFQRDRNPEHDYDYDLLSDTAANTGSKEPHAVYGVPVYAANRPEGDFSLDPASPGYEAGVPIPNFNDGFRGKAPDMGAFEKGSPPMEFGVGAYLGRPRPTR